MCCSDFLMLSFSSNSGCWPWYHRPLEFMWPAAVPRVRSRKAKTTRGTCVHSEISCKSCKSAHQIPNWTIMLQFRQHILCVCMSVVCLSLLARSMNLTAISFSYSRFMQVRDSSTPVRREVVMCLKLFVNCQKCQKILFCTVAG